MLNFVAHLKRITMNTHLNRSKEHKQTTKKTKEINRPGTGEMDPSETKIVDPSEKTEDEEGQVKPIRPKERNPKKMED
jgi:hypothetical protein